MFIIFELFKKFYLFLYNLLALKGRMYLVKYLAK